MNKKLSSPKLLSEETVGRSMSHTDSMNTLKNDRTKMHKVTPASFEYTQRRKISLRIHILSYFSLSKCSCNCMVDS